jgi:hypothetical protein
MNTKHGSFKAGFAGDTISNMGARKVQARVHDNIIRVCEDFHAQGRFVEALVKDTTVQNSTSHRIRALVVQVVLCQAASCISVPLERNVSRLNWILIAWVGALSLGC